jgi:hypothetical protein
MPIIEYAQIVHFIFLSKKPFRMAYFASALPQFTHERCPSNPNSLAASVCLEFAALGHHCCLE